MAKPKSATFPPVHIPTFYQDGFEYSLDHQIDCSGFDMTKPNEEIERRMKETFDKLGLVHLINTGLTDMQEMRRWIKVVLEREMEYKGGANSRVRIEKNVYDTGAPKEAWLHYHHEMAYVTHSTKMLGFCAAASVKNKGYTYVSDGIKTTNALLQTSLGQKLKEKDICYVRYLTDREYYKGKEQGHIYNHWQQSFLTESPDEAQKMAEERGLKVEWLSNRLMKTKFYVSAFEYFEPLDRNLLYSSLADDHLWFDTWPGLEGVHPDERPLKFTFGDDTELSEEEKTLFVEIFDRFGIPVKWEQGDVAIVCNYRWAHGRPAYDLEEGEERTLGVLLGETFERVGHLEDKWGESLPSSAA
mmetsp:Transcript_29930/g.41381  ORF Transcript_29930/g.41381 Transcript_29930/m.41381 type:complete len:357 (-) Transcript_29930:80-1150(-)